jgi:pyruvate formate lyase activating enzyme
MANGYINSVESFGSVDGPGVRYIFFLQGCRMRCAYCHNPETWKIEGGQVLSPEEAFGQAYRYRAYWKKQGGITVSGGEALLQIDFVTDLFKIAKAHGVHTTIDTSGNPFTKEEPFFSKFQALMEVTDLFLLDIKEIDADRHKSLTGFTNANILELAKYLSENGKDMWIRNVLVPGLTDREEDLKALGTFVAGLGHVQRFEVLPYHTLGVSKYQKLGIPYRLSGIEPASKEAVQRAETIMGCERYQGYLTD